MKRKTTYYYELFWIIPSLLLPIGMLATLLFTSYGADVHLPGAEGRVDPAKLDSTPPFDNPGVVQVGPSRYEVRMVGEIWSFNPSEIHLPAGSEVTFVATSRDVVHGLFIPRTNVNVMVLPGQIARATARFDKPGTYLFICHEYCGAGHHTMAGQIIVDAADNGDRGGK
ncbi:MAG: cytochrome c oxidase subunit II [Acidobacteria bacterium]|nr:cytochrome c oxidase subunit II [Acidobacteriota bacterium]